jgi:hypothetical protein
MDADGSLDDIRVSHDEVAASYADQQRDSLDGEPYLRAALAPFAQLSRPSVRDRLDDGPAPRGRIGGRASTPARDHG